MTKQIKHTPGPWKSEGIFKNRSVVLAPAGFHVAYVGPVTSNGFPEDEKAKANARLIAAAPDLLAYAECESDRYTMAGESYHDKYGFPAFGNDGDARRAELRGIAIGKAVEQ